MTLSGLGTSSLKACGSSIKTVPSLVMESPSHGAPTTSMGGSGPSEELIGVSFSSSTRGTKGRSMERPSLLFSFLQTLDGSNLRIYPGLVSHLPITEGFRHLFFFRFRLARSGLPPRPVVTMPPPLESSPPLESPSRPPTLTSPRLFFLMAPMNRVDLFRR